MRSILAVLLIPVVIGCADPTVDPETKFRDLEARLLSADSVAFDFHVVSLGVIDGDMSGSAMVTSDGRLTIAAAGSFIGRNLDAQVTTDADSMRLDTTELSDTIERPKDTFRAVLIGMTRMGFLHNLAQLTTVSPPEAADGGVSEWITVDNFSEGEVGPYRGPHFDLLVDGQKTSSAALAIEDGVPVLRTQVVEFPGGNMEVTETYTNFRIYPSGAK